MNEQCGPLETHVLEFERCLQAFRRKLATERIAVADVAIESSATTGVRFALRARSGRHRAARAGLINA